MAAASLVATPTQRTEIAMTSGIRLVLTVDPRRFLAASLHSVRARAWTRLCFACTTAEHQPIRLTDDALWVDGVAFEVLSKRETIRGFLTDHGVNFQEGAH